MKYLNWILIIIFLNLAPVEAHDVIATQIFTTEANDTIEVVQSGHTSATINGMTGALGNSLSVRFAVTSNVAISNLKIRALVETYNVGSVGGFRSSATSNGNNLPVTLVLGNTNTSYQPCNCCVHDAMGIPTPCVATGLYTNTNAIAYTGDITIDNGGTLSYVDDSVESYFLANLNTDTTNIDIDLGVTARSGTYDINEAWDTLGTYVTTIYLDNIPD